MKIWVKSLLETWQKILLFGTKPNAEYRINRVILYINITNLIVFPISFCFTLFYLLHGYYILALTSAPLLVMIGLNISLIKLNKHHLAQLTTIVFTTISAANGVFYLGYHAYNQTYLMCIFAIAPLFLASFSRKAMYYSLFAVATTALGIEYLQYSLFKGFLNIDKLVIETLYILSPIISLISVFVIAVAYLDIMIKSQASALNKEGGHIEDSKLGELLKISNGIAYELNDPLAIMNLSCEQIEYIISKKNLWQKHPILLKHARKIIDSLDIVSEIVVGLKKFSRLNATEAVRKVEINELISDSQILFREAISRYQIKFSVESPEEAIWFIANPSQLTQAIYNIIKNSIDHIIEAPEKWIKIVIKLENSSIIIKFMDSGNKVDQNIEPFLMQPFFTTKSKEGHIGLGLSTVTSILNRHQGRIYYDQSNPNNCFIIEMPTGVSDTSKQ